MGGVAEAGVPAVVEGGPLVDAVVVLGAGDADGLAAMDVVRGSPAAVYAARPSAWWARTTVSSTTCSPP